MDLSKSHKAYFEAAKAMAQLSDFPRTSVGAVAVYKHRIISSGCNSKKTSPIQKKYNKYRFLEETPHCTHAEVACLKPLVERKDIDFKNVSIYVYRENKLGELSCSRPCPSCIRLIKDVGIKNVYFTNEGGFSHEIILN